MHLRVFLFLCFGLLLSSIVSGSVLEIARQRKIGKTSRPIRLRFHQVPGGTIGEERKNIVISSAREWSNYANIDFEFSTGEYDFLIDIYTSSTPATVTLGTHGSTDFQNRLISLNMPVYASLAEISHVALHELGHVLGLQHEHQHPDRPFHFDLDYLLSKCGLGPKDCKSSVEYNSGRVFEGPGYILSSYDQDSIMHYPVGRPLIVEPVEVEEKEVLSLGDKLMMMRAYPGRSDEGTVRREHEKLMAILRRSTVKDCQISKEPGSKYYKYSYANGQPSLVLMLNSHQAAVSAYLDPECGNQR